MCNFQKTYFQLIFFQGLKVFKSIKEAFVTTIQVKATGKFI